MEIFDIETMFAQMPLSRALIYAGITFIFLLIILALTLLFYYLNLNWAIYGGIVGSLFGFVAGTIILVKVPTKLQIGGIGAVTGMGLDQMVNSLHGTNGTTVVDAIANIVAKLINSVIHATEKTGIPNPSIFPLSIGIWLFLIVIAIMMLFASLEEKEEEQNGTKSTPNE